MTDQERAAAVALILGDIVFCTLNILVASPWSRCVLAWKFHTPIETSPTCSGVSSERR